MLSRKKVSLRLLVGTVLVLAAGGIAVSWLWSRQQTEAIAEITGADLIPPTTLMAISVSTNPDGWTQVRQFGTPDTRLIIDQALAELRDQLLTPYGYSYAQDIQPWLGQTITVALLPPVSNAVATSSSTATPTVTGTQPLPLALAQTASTSRSITTLGQLTSAVSSSIPTPNRPTSNPVSGSKLTPVANAAISDADGIPAMVMILPVERPTTAEQLFNQPSLLQAGQWSSRTYKGVTIRDQVIRDREKPAATAPRPQYSIAILRRGNLNVANPNPLNPNRGNPNRGDQEFLVVTTHPQLTNLVIETQQGQPALSQSPGYQQAAGQLRAIAPFAQVYVNVPAIALSFAKDMGLHRPGQIINPPQTQGFLSTINLESEGLRIKGLSWVQQRDTGNPLGSPTIGQMLTLLPSDTLLMLSGSNLTQLWQRYAHSSSSQLLSWLDPGTVRNTVETSLGLNLDQDLLSWMEGEFCLAILPAPQSSTNADPASQPANSIASPFTAGVVLMVQVSDRRAAEQVLRRVDQVLLQKYKFRLEVKSIADQSVVEWISPAGQLLGTRGWLEDDVAFLTLGAPIAATLINPSQPNLSQNNGFRLIIPQDFNPSHLSLFLDFDRTFNGNSLPFLQLPPQSQGLWQAVQSLGGRVTINNQQTAHYDWFIRLKRIGSVPPFPSPVPSPRTRNS